MEDKNQNTIPGTLRTLKTDLSSDKNPQDRIQQAGNFMQARPTMDMSNNSQVPIEDNIVTPDIVATPPVDAQKAKPETQKLGGYSWSNTKEAPSMDMPVTSVVDTPTKSGFTALDDSMDIPLSSSMPSSNPITITPTPPPADTAKSISSTPSNTTTSNMGEMSFDTQPQSPKKKSSFKGVFSAIILIILVGLIGGGIYFYMNIRSTSPTPTISDNDNPIPPNNTETPSSEIRPIIQPTKKIDIAFLDTEPIRKTIATKLNSENGSLIEMNLTKDNVKVNLIDLSTALGITFPADITSELVDYWMYAYRQEGIYKLTGVIQLKDNKDAGASLTNWAVSIPRDMSGFSLNSASRIVTSPEIKRSIITGPTGKVFNNYYYNYTSNTDSIDVSSNVNYIIMASSQDSMKYMTEQIK